MYMYVVASTSSMHLKIFTDVSVAGDFATARAFYERAAVVDAASTVEQSI